MQNTCTTYTRPEETWMNFFESFSTLDWDTYCWISYEFRHNFKYNGIYVDVATNLVYNIHLLVCNGNRCEFFCVHWLQNSLFSWLVCTIDVWFSLGFTNRFEFEQNIEQLQVQLNGTDAQLLISVSKPVGQLFHTVCCALSEAIYHIVSFAIGLAILQTLGKNTLWKVMMKIETEFQAY